MRHIDNEIVRMELGDGFKPVRFTWRGIIYKVSDWQPLPGNRKEGNVRSTNSSVTTRCFKSTGAAPAIADPKDDAWWITEVWERKRG